MSVHYHQKAWGHDFVSCGKLATVEKVADRIGRVTCCTCLRRVIADAAAERQELLEKIKLLEESSR